MFKHANTTVITKFLFYYLPNGSHKIVNLSLGDIKMAL